MKKLVLLATLLFFVGSIYGCAANKSPVVNPIKTIDIVGEYEFQTVGVGAGHGFMFLPGVIPTKDPQNASSWLHIVPTGEFVFYGDDTFRIRFKFESRNGLDDKAREEFTRFDEVTGTYKINSEQVLTLTTKYGISEYLYSINSISSMDSDGKQYPTFSLRMIPAHPWHPLWVGDDSSTQGRSLFDIIYLLRKDNKK